MSSNLGPTASGGGGVRQVKRLPTPEKGIGNIYYVREAYQGPGPWLEEDFNLALTPANVASAGDPALGYSASAQRVDLTQRVQGGTITPTPEGLLALIIQTQGGALPGIPVIKLGGSALTQAEGRGLTLTFDGNSYNFLQIPESDTWGVAAANQQIPQADIWAAGTPVTVQIGITGTNRRLNYRGFAAVGEKTKPPVGFYRQEDLQFIVTPGALRGDNSIFGYAEGPLDVIVTQAGGMIDPLPQGVRGIYAGAGGAATLYTDDALAAILEASSDPVRMIFGGNSYTLPRFGSDNIWQTVGQPVPNAELWTDGTPVAVVIRQGDRALGADGFHIIGGEINPDRIEGGEPVNRGFWHVDQETLEWREGFGGAGGGGGIPAAVLFETGLSDADIRDLNWRGVLVGIGRDDSGPEWRLRTRAGQEAVNAAQASVSITSGGATLTVTLNENAAEGAAGNAWRFRIVSGALTSAGRAPGSTEVQLTVGAGATFNNAVSVINQRSALDGNRYTAALTAGAGGTAFPQSLAGVQNFAGGLDAVPAAELGVEMDVGNKVIELEHLVGHTQAEIVEFLNDNEIDAETTLFATLYGGSDGTATTMAAPQERPFSQVYSQGSLPRPSEGDLEALKQRLDSLSFSDITGQIADTQVPASFTRDAELTQSFLLGILGLTAQQLNDLFVNAVVEGSGAGRSVLVTQADGTTIRLALPDTTGGGGGGSNDGVVSAAAFAADGTTLTLTLSTGATVTANVPALLRQAGLSQSQVQALIDAAEADDLSASDVASQIQSTITSRRIPQAPAAGAAATYYDLLVGTDGTTSWAPATRGTTASTNPTVRNLTADYTVVAADLGNTVRLTGATARTFTLPAHGSTIPIGAMLFVVNDATAELTLDGNGADTVDGNANFVLIPNEAITVQKVGNNAWDLISDTTSGEPTTWASIPTGSTVKQGQVVIHNGAFFGALVEHVKGSTGPDGDPTNWQQISNWRGNWADAWYPEGSFVRHQGLPWVSTQLVRRGDPAPGASTDVKWLLLGASPSNVVIASSNTSIPATADHDTYIHTGSADITYTLPAASGGSAVDDGWEVVLTNQGAGDLTITANGADTIDSSSADIVLEIGETIRIQKVANGAWILIADTRGEAAAADLPTVVNVSVDTAIPATAHGDTYRVTGNTSRTITLPDPDDVPVGFFVRVANGSLAGTDHSVAREGAGQTIEGGNGPLTVPPGEVVTIQKVNSQEWEIIGDTQRGGGARVGGLATSLIGRGNYDVTTSNDWTSQANSPDITIPAEGKWAIVNFGGSSAVDAPRGPWHWIDLDRLRGRTPGVYGGDIATQARMDFYGSELNRTLYLGITAERKLLFSSSDASEDATPLEIRLVTSVDIPDSSGVTETGEVKDRNADYTLVDGDEGDTIRLTGATARTFSLPDIDGTNVELGWEAVIVNASTAVLTLDGNGADTIGGAATVEIPAGHALRVQAVTASAWAIIADTRQGSGATDSTARADAARALAAANAKQDALTTAQRLGLLQFDVVPSTVVGYTVAGQPADWLTDWRIWVSGGDTVGDVWMSMTIEGLVTSAAPAPTTPGASLARHKLSATNIYNYTFANANRTTLVDGRLTRRQGRDIEIDLFFHDAASGGNVLDVVTIAVDWLGTPNPGVQTITPTAAAVVVRADTASVVNLNMNRAVNLNISGGTDGDSLLVRAIQDTTGNRTLALNATIQREGRPAPVLSTAANAADYLYFHKRGANWIYFGIIKAA